MKVQYMRRTFTNLLFQAVSHDPGLALSCLAMFMLTIFQKVYQQGCNTFVDFLMLRVLSPTLRFKLCPMQLSLYFRLDLSIFSFINQVTKKTLQNRKYPFNIFPELDIFVKDRPVVVGFEIHGDNAANFIS